jgi:hypothetical protein
MAIMCDDTPLCRQYTDDIALRYGGATRRAEVDLKRRWLSFESAPAHFIIAIVPPRP